MKRLISIFSLVGLLFALPVYAMDTNDVNSAGFDDLTPSQQADVIKEIAKMKDNAKEASVSTKADEVAKWVNIGTNIGKGLAGAAKELGIAANDFAKTPVGQMTMFLIMWHFMGSIGVHFVGGLLVWTIGISLIYITMRRYQPLNIEIKNDPTTGKQVSKTKVRQRLDEGATIAFLFAFAVVIVIGLWTMFAY